MKLLIPGVALLVLALVIVLRPAPPSGDLLPADEPPRADPLPAAPMPPQDPRRKRAVDLADAARHLEPAGLARLEAMPARDRAGALEEVRAGQARALDPATPEPQRVKAFERLARRDALSPETRAGLLGLLQASANPAHRADLARALRGRAGEPEVREALLLRLLGDVSDGVRRTAAETLLEARGDPRVAEALSRAARSDASKAVRQTVDRGLKTDYDFKERGF